MITAIAAQQAAANQSRQRRLVVLAGDRQWSRVLIAKAFEDLALPQACWVSDDAPVDAQCISLRQTQQLLGQERYCLVFDAWSGLDPDALATVTGTLVAGGLLFLLTPPFAQWPRYDDPDYQRLLVHPYDSSAIRGHFVQHIISSVLTARQVLLIEEGELPRPTTTVDTPAQQRQTDGTMGSDGCVTVDQSRAVAAIRSVMSRRPRRPLVITADRGRGKSAALGIASAQLMQQGDCTIIITAPSREAAAVALEHAGLILEGASRNKQGLYWQQSSLRFIAPDELLHNDYAADLLLVDEAAAIPAFLLEDLLLRYPRMVFASTVHGYEGTGRGFEVRFKQKLSQLTPQWKALSMQQPIRWAADDPVEQWLFDALLLNASPVNDSLIAGADVNSCVSEKINQHTLAGDRHLLAELFGLLVLSHYQTSPADLRILLDGLNVSVWVSRFQGHIVAAALVADEGELEASLTIPVWKGQRRPKGHLLPQVLSAHGGFQQASSLRYQRIVRITVHPALQRQGLGQQLVDAIITAARAGQVDLVGSSFAATADVLGFWRQVDMVPVLLGTSRDASSGCHSVQVLSALTARGNALMSAARQRFCEQFPRQIPLLYPQLESQLIASLLIGTHTHNPDVLSQQDWLDSEAFVEGFRPLTLCLLPLWKLSCRVLSCPNLAGQLTADQQALLIQRVLQNRSAASVVKSQRQSGKKQLQDELRETVKLIRDGLIEQLNTP